MQTETNARAAKDTEAVPGEGLVAQSGIELEIPASHARMLAEAQLLARLH